MSIAKEMHSAEDIVSETFLRATRHCICYNELPARAWFYKVTRNIALDLIRKNKKIEFCEMEEAEDADIGANPELSAVHSERMEILGWSLSRIPEPYKSVLVLKEYDNLTYEEIAKVMSISIDNVKVILFRGRQKLRNLYRREYENEV